MAAAENRPNAHEEETLILIAATALRVDSLDTVMPAAGIAKITQADKPSAVS